MTKKESILKAIVELAVTEGRIEELKRSKTWMSNASSYYRNRLNVLEDKVEKLQNIIDGKDVKELKLTFHVPESKFPSSFRLNASEPEEIVQYLQRESLVRE